MNDIPLISVIVPIYQVEKYVSACIQSILNQSFTNLEILLVDDGSKDGSPEICDRFKSKDSRVRVFHTENHGVSAARNVGLINMKGEYFTFVDGDDRLTEHAIEILLKYAEYYHADLVSAQQISVSPNECYNEPNYSKWTPEKNQRIIKDENSLIESMNDQPVFYDVKRKLFRCELLSGIRFDEDIRIHEDSLYIFKCCLKKPVVVDTSEVIYLYSKIDGSTSHSPFSEKYFDILKVLEKKLKLTEAMPQLKIQRCNITVKSNMALLRLLFLVDNPAWKPHEKKCLYEVRKNAKYFVATNHAELKWFWIIRLHMYRISKILYNSKR